MRNIWTLCRQMSVRRCRQYSTSRLLFWMFPNCSQMFLTKLGRLVFPYSVFSFYNFLHTVKGREAGHLRVKGPQTTRCWPFGWFVCLKLWTSILSCCMKSGKAKYFVWWGRWYPTWPQIGNDLETGHQHIYHTITYTIIITLTLYTFTYFVKFHKYFQDFRVTPSCPTAPHFCQIRNCHLRADFDDRARFWNHSGQARRRTYSSTILAI